MFVIHLTGTCGHFDVLIWWVYHAGTAFAFEFLIIIDVFIVFQLPQVDTALFTGCFCNEKKEEENR